MKQFDAVSSRQRLIQRLRQNPDWQVVLADSVVDSLLSTVAEETAEIARYAEYLFSESKWDTAQNFGSITAAAGQVGYVPSRAKSASGTVYISLDSRTHNVGTQIAVDTFLDTTSLPAQNWRVAQNNITLIQGSTVITDTQGNQFTLVNTIDLPAGATYVEAAVVEGAVQALTIEASQVRALAQFSRLDPFIYVPVLLENAEAAESTITSRFFTVIVETAAGEQEFRVVDSLLLSGVQERNVEIIVDLYNSNLIYLKFNAKQSRGPAVDLSPGSSFERIVVTYLSSRGADGNTDALTKFSITTPASSIPLYGINTLQLAGGRDRETAAEIKDLAPEFYLRTFTTATRQAYEEAIRNIDFGAGVFASQVRVTGRRATTDQDAAILVSLLSPTLEARLQTGVLTEDGIVNRIEQLLGPLKAPSDFFEYSPAVFVPLAFGIQISRPTAVAQATSGELESAVRNFLEGFVGASSDLLNFDRRLTPSFIATEIRNLAPELRRNDVDVSFAEVEAVSLIDWRLFENLVPNPDPLRPCRTLRLPFSFNKVFATSQFKQGQTYALRIDMLFRRTAAATSDFNTTIFIEDFQTRTNQAFYYKADPFNVWPFDVSTVDYPFGEDPNNLGTIIPDEGVSELTTAYQYYLTLDKARVFTDDDYLSLTSESGRATDPPLVPGFSRPGTQRQFIAYLQINQALDNDDDYADGFLEFSIDDIYLTLQRFASSDPILQSLLTQYPLNVVKCTVGDDSAFNGFVNDVLAQYLQIYVSVRLRNTAQGLSPSTLDEEATVLLADTAESDINTTNTVSLRDLKQRRFLSVEVENI